MRLVCVTLNAPDDWNDHKYLLDKAFSEYRMVSYSADSFKLSLDVSSSVAGTAEAVPQSEIKLLLHADDELSVTLEAPRILFAGGIEGERVGKMSVFVNGALAAQEDLVYTEDVKLDTSQRLTPYERLSRMLDTALRPYYIGEEK